MSAFFFVYAKSSWGSYKRFSAIRVGFYALHLGARMRITPLPFRTAVGASPFCLVIIDAVSIRMVHGSAVIRERLWASAVAPFLPRIYYLVQVVGRSVYSLRSGVLLTLVFQLPKDRFCFFCNFFCTIYFNFYTFVET